MQENNIFLLKITKLLKEKGLTQTDLAKKVGITQASLSKILSGQNSTKVITVQKLAKALDVPVSCLIDDEQITSKNSNNPENNNSVYELIKDFRRCMEDQIKVINLKIDSLRNEIIKN